MSRSFLLWLFVVWLLSWFAIPSAGEGRGSGTIDDPYRVPRTETGVRIDASLDDLAWQDALELELNYEVQPGENVPPPVETSVLLTHDARCLYIAFRCHDPQPDEIRARLADRDHVDSDDWVGIILDSFNDERRSFDFLVNPVGVQADFIETSTGSVSWDGIWDSAAAITDWGYAVEIEVPFDQLRFQRCDGSQIWGFDAVRRYPRSLNHHIGAFPRDRSNNCYLCQAIKIEGFEGARPGRNIEISPTVTGVSTDAGDHYPFWDEANNHEETEFGVTGKWGITPNLTLSATGNPDFSQIEADALQLDINQPFALWYAERRPFFLEAGDFFHTLKRVVYTRTMRDPLWGVKLTGKEAGNTIGGYVVRDDLTNLIFPGSEGSSATSINRECTATVLRYKRDLGSRYTLGAYLTDRQGSDYLNRVYGFDTNLLITPTNQIQLQLLGSQTEYPDRIVGNFDQPSGQFSDKFIAFEYDHNSRTAGWWLDFDQVGRDFRADLGFIPRVGFRNVEGGLNYRWTPEERSWWSGMGIGNEVNYYEDADGKPLDRGGNVWAWYEGPMQSNLYMEGSRYRESYRDRSFDLNGYTVSAGFRPRGSLRISGLARYGNRIDYAHARRGTGVYLSPYVAYDVGKHARLSFDYGYERLNVAGGRLYSAHLAEAWAIFHFDVRAFMRAIVQYRNYRFETERYEHPRDPESSELYTQLLFSYTISPRTVLYAGYSDGYRGSDEYGLRQREKTLFAKMGYVIGL